MIDHVIRIKQLIYNRDRTIDLHYLTKITTSDALHAHQTDCSWRNENFFSIVLLSCSYIKRQERGLIHSLTSPADYVVTLASRIGWALKVAACLSDDS